MSETEQKLTKKLTIVKVGNDIRPATKENLTDVKKQIQRAIRGQDAIIVSHHAIDIQTYEIPFDTKLVTQPKDLR